MKNNIVQIRDVENYKDFLGNKTLNLKKLINWEFNVPEFVALPCYISKRLFNDENFREEIVAEILQDLKCDRYAVRSSALVEDCKNCSMAGQFLTETNLLNNELEQGIYKILKHAKSFLNEDLDKFSIIVQEYILADVSGVAFTRNPNGNREMIVEYANCEGEKIVSGQITPTKNSFYWSEKNANLPDFFIKNNLISVFKEVENKYYFPQDIEWCIKDDELYLLQSRAITTITKDQYERITFLENFLAKEKKYFYEKTEISEIAPRPTNIVYDLLNLIYTKDGPVSNVYKKYGINYKSKDFLKIIGNELFVDKEKEIQGLLSSYSFLKNDNFIPQWTYFSKSFSTIKNLFFLNKIKTKSYNNLFLKLKNLLEEKENVENDIQKNLQKFLQEYELIFEINLLAGLSIKKVDLLLKNEKVNFTDILNSSSHFVNLNKYNIKLSSNLEMKGNSLDLVNESEFVRSINLENKVNKKVLNWWDILPDYKKRVFSSRLKEVIVYNHLRELDRWLTVKNVSTLRKNISNFAEEKNFESKRNIYFSEFNEILNDEISESLCIKRKDEYKSLNKFSLPSKLTHSFIVENSVTQGVSEGVAEGMLVNIENIEKNDLNKKVIIYTEVLFPELTKYFDSISGIVANKGGMLSHLAIMARERKIPVVVGFSFDDNDIKLGDHVKIDGSSGKIKII